MNTYNQNQPKKYNNSYNNNYKSNYNSKQNISDIWINESQLQNPIWGILKIPKQVRKNQISDFVIPDSNISIIFLSLQFHQKYPLYVNDKIDKYVESEDYKTYTNRIMLFLMDCEDDLDFIPETKAGMFILYYFKGLIAGNLGQADQMNLNWKKSLREAMKNQLYLDSYRAQYGMYLTKMALTIPEFQGPVQQVQQHIEYCITKQGTDSTIDPQFFYGVEE